MGEVAYDELYQALDWLLARQPAIETALARRHLKGGTLVLYDVSSGYVEGRCCPLAKRGYNGDGKKGKLQIVYGLLCAADGCPVAVEVFDGNTGDPKTLAVQIDKLKVRFGLAHVVLVGDRGMITQARIREDVVPANLDWITALRAPDIKTLAEDGKLQLTLLVALQTGLRASELINLRCKDAVLGTGAHIRCDGKGRKERCTPLRRDTVKLLEQWLRERRGGDDHPLFPTMRGERLSRDALEHLVRRHALTASASCPSLVGKRVSPQVLRHSTGRSAGRLSRERRSR